MGPPTTAHGLLRPGPVAAAPRPRCSTCNHLRSAAAGGRKCPAPAPTNAIRPPRSTTCTRRASPPTPEPERERGRREWTMVATGLAALLAILALVLAAFTFAD